MHCAPGQYDELRICCVSLLLIGAVRRFPYQFSDRIPFVQLCLNRCEKFMLCEGLGEIVVCTEFHAHAH